MFYPTLEIEYYSTIISDIINNNTSPEESFLEFSDRVTKQKIVEDGEIMFKDISNLVQNIDKMLCRESNDEMIYKVKAELNKIKEICYSVLLPF